jgi:hypothetical protein
MSTRAGRSQVEKTVVSMMAPRRIPVGADPPDNVEFVKVDKTVTIDVGFTANEAFDLTVAKVSAALPGGQTYWNRCRIESVKVWGSASPGTAAKSGESTPLIVRLPSDASWSQPISQWEDSGTAGQRRPAVGFQLGLLDRARWFGTSDNHVLCTIVQGIEEGTIQTVVIHVSASWMSPVPNI